MTAKKSQAARRKKVPVYNPIDPASDYNRGDLIKHYEDFSDMRKYLQILQKDPENTDVWEDAGKLIWGDPFHYLKQHNSPRHNLETTLSEEYDNFGEYAKRHSSTLYEKLEPEDYADLIQRVPLYKTGNREHDGLVEVMVEHRKLAEASKDTEKMADYIGEKRKEVGGSFPKWLEISLMVNGESDLRALFDIYANSANARLKAIMLDEKGKVRSGFLERVFRDSLDEAEKELNEEDYSDKEKNDVWQRNIRPYYMALVEKAYEQEKKSEKEEGDIPQKKKDRDKRREDRRAKGMLF